MRSPEPPLRRGNRFDLSRRAGAAVAVALGVLAAGGAITVVRVETAGAARGPMSAADLGYLKEAAKSCPALTPARLAGQIMAPTGAAPAGDAVRAAVGNAEWKAWSPWPGASSADHRANIVALAHETCDVVGRLRVAKVGGDPWQTAVAAMDVGTESVVAARGVPASAATHVRTVVETADWYARQPPFGGMAAVTTSRAARPAHTASTGTPTPAATKINGAAVSKPAPSSTPADTTSPTPSQSGPSMPGRVILVDPQVRYQISNPFAGRVLDLPDNDTNTRTGTDIQLWTNQKAADQYWRIWVAPTAGYVQIINSFSRKALSVRENSGLNGDNDLVEQLPLRASDRTQEWQLRDAGDGTVWIVSRATGKTLDLLGDDLPAADGTRVNMWTLQTWARDQRWKITP
jgi:hypothetical protein